MTSKEALERIKWNVLTSTLIQKEEHLDLCEQLEKDLEILEILKRLFLNEGAYYDFNYGICVDSSVETTKEEQDLVKEWLENETL